MRAVTALAIGALALIVASFAAAAPAKADSFGFYAGPDGFGVHIHGYDDGYYRRGYPLCWDRWYREYVPCDYYDGYYPKVHGGYWHGRPRVHRKHWRHQRHGWHRGHRGGHHRWNRGHRRGHDGWRRGHRRGHDGWNRGHRGGKGSRGRGHRRGHHGR